MASLSTYREALNEMHALFAEGRLSKASYLVTKRAINNQVFKVMRDMARTMPSADFHREVRENDFQAIERKVLEYFGHV